MKSEREFGDDDEGMGTVGEPPLWQILTFCFVFGLLLGGMVALFIFGGAPS